MLLGALVIMALNRRCPSVGVSLSWKMQLNCTMSAHPRLIDGSPLARAHNFYSSGLHGIAPYDLS